MSPSMSLRGSPNSVLSCSAGCNCFCTVAAAVRLMKKVSPSAVDGSGRFSFFGDGVNFARFRGFFLGGLEFFITVAADAFAGKGGVSRVGERGLAFLGGCLRPMFLYPPPFNRERCVAGFRARGV